MDVTKLFERGSQAFERGNWELAMMVWQQLLAMQPDHVNARKMLREAENRKWVQEGGAGVAKALALAKGLPSIAAFGVHMVSKNYDRAMIDCEKVLARDPYCVPMVWGLAMAALKGGHADVAIVTFEYIHERKPGNTKALRHLGYLYEEKGEIARAIDAWTTLRRVLPNDREGQTKLRDLAAVKTMVDGKYETATQKGATYRDSLRSTEESEDREQEHRAIRTDDDLQRAIDRVSKDVEQNPNQKRYVIQLGDLYRRAGELEKARELYQRAQQLDGMDLSIPERLGELSIDQYEAQEKALADRLRAAPDDEILKAQLDALRKERFEYSLNEYRRQVQVRPTDSVLRAKLGDLYFQAKMFDEAAPEYQKASADPRARRRCRKMLGICLYNTGKHQLAASQFEQAMEGGLATSPEIRDIMYYLAVTLEKLGNFDRAEEVLRQIFDADMAYKDVQKRLDRVMQAKQQAAKTQPTPTGEAS